MTYILTNNAEAISKELYKLSRPMDDSDNMIFGVIEKDGEFAMEVNLEEEILIHPLKDTTNLKNLIDYAENEKDQLEAYIDSIVEPQEGDEPESGWVLGRFPFGNLVQGFTDIKDHQWMIDNGWIPASEEYPKTPVYKKVVNWFKNLF